MDDVPGWLTNPVNNRIRQLRIEDMGLNGEEIQDLFYWINISGMRLLSAEIQVKKPNLITLVRYAFKK